MRLARHCITTVRRSVTLCDAEAHQCAPRLFTTTVEDHSSSANGGNASPNTTSTPFAAGNKQQQGAKKLTDEQRNVLSKVMRASLLAEGAAVQVWQGRRIMAQNRPDLQQLLDKEQEMLTEMKTLAQQHQQDASAPQFRPSALSPVTNLAAIALGAAILPRKTSAAVLAGVQSALTESYNESLRELHESGIANTEQGLRQVIRQARDTERVPEGGPDKVPDILDARRLNELSLEEGVAAVVGSGLKAILSLGRTV